MNAPDIMFALPAAPAAAAVLLTLLPRKRACRRTVLAVLTLALPIIALLAYRLWERFVGPGAFTAWQFGLSPANLSFVLPLAAAAPLFLWLLEGRHLEGGRGSLAEAFSLLALSAALAAFMSRHLLLLACLFFVCTLSMGLAALVSRRGGWRIFALPFLPLGLADLCLALGILFYYLSDPGRGLFFTAPPLQPRGLEAASCGLLLAAALFRLGCLPFHRWMVKVSGGGRDLRLLHLLAVDLSLGTFLLYNVTQVFFVWEGVWIWICFGVSSLTLLEVLREIAGSASFKEAWGLLCAALGAHLMIISSAGGQLASAALCFGLWAGIIALAMVYVGSGRRRGTTWVLVLGGASLMGLPPLAGFTWRWMEFQVAAARHAGGAYVIFLAAVPLLFAGGLVEGFVSLNLSRDAGDDLPVPASALLGLGMAALALVMGLYPGNLIDMLTREYGLPVDLPFTGWSSVGWALIICGGVAVSVLIAWYRRAGVERRDARVVTLLPLCGAGRANGGPLSRFLGGRYGLLLSADLLLYSAWGAVIIYLVAQ